MIHRFQVGARQCLSYRHFVERDDFEIFVATDSAEVEQYQVPYPFLRFDVPKWLKRMQHTRLYQLVLAVPIGGSPDYLFPHEV